jgi:two-component system alkaline phosphatase synthesis response regulator PhoP
MGKKAKILLVDDDPDFVESTKAILKNKYDVVTALGGEEGLHKTKEEKPDLVILDIIMPDKDGFTVCRELKGDPELAKIPVLMLTAFSERYMETSVAVSQGLTLEAEDFIDKPITPAELLIRVERLLRSFKPSP